MDTLLKTIGVLGVIASSFILLDFINSKVFNAVDVGMLLACIFLAIIIYGIGELIKLLKDIKSNTDKSRLNYENNISQDKEDKSVK